MLDFDGINQCAAALREKRVDIRLPANAGMKRLHDACILEQRAQALLDQKRWLRRRAVRPLVKKMTAGSQNAKGVEQNLSPVGRQVKETRNHHRVERPASEWQRCRRRQHGIHSCGRRFAAQDVEHFPRAVRANDTIAGSRERNRNAASAGGHVQDASM